MKKKHVCIYGPMTPTPSSQRRLYGQLHLGESGVCEDRALRSQRPGLCKKNLSSPLNSKPELQLWYCFKVTLWKLKINVGLRIRPWGFSC